MSAVPTIEITQARKPVIESTLPLINIVFLLLIFFLVAGTLQTPLVNTIDAPKAGVTFDEVQFLPSEWLYADAYGRLSFENHETEGAAVSAALKDGSVVLFADQDLRGSDLASILRSIEDAGGERVMLVTELERGQ